MMTQETSIDLNAWLERAFQGNIPGPISEKLETHRADQNSFEELMTQLPTETRPVVEQLYSLHRADHDMFLMILENLFLRHLENHVRA